MLGFQIVRPTITRFQWWIMTWLALFSNLITILTLGYVATDWDIEIFVYFLDKKHPKPRGPFWNYLQKGPAKNRKEEREKEKCSRCIGKY